ncbi:NAD(P)-binding domain-containing protein [Cellulomonas sp. CW35]|uniref:NAD(P)-binding domain-containing protein n=1 Tax=Cellulomonas sp. CW35 TaxID=3458249 RepID=UPI004033742B
MDLSPDLSRVSGRDRDPVPAATAPTGAPTREDASPSRTVPPLPTTADPLDHRPDAGAPTNPSGTRRVTRRSLREAADAAAEPARADLEQAAPATGAPGRRATPDVPQPSRSTRRSRRAAVSEAPTRPVVDVDVVVIGAGQAGLSAAYHLHKAGLVPVGDRGWQDAEATFVVLDDAPAPGGAWQHRPPGMRVSDAHGVHDLPGMPLLVPDPAESAAHAVPYYFAQYEEAFGLHVQRPVAVTRVEDEDADEAPAGGRRLVVTSHLVDSPGEEVLWRARGLVNASGTWRKPFWPTYPGRAAFRGRQLHSRDVLDPGALADGHVVVVGGGTSAAQLLLALADVTTTTWVTRRPPAWRDGQLTPELGRAAVALVDERTRAGLPPGSIVSVTGLPLTDAYRAGIDAGVLRARPAFSRIVPDGVVWDDPVPPPVPAAEPFDGVVPGLGAWVGGDAHVAAGTLVWATGYRPALDHLAPLRLRGPRGGIVMDGTRVAADPRLHLVGYGPSASTVGANRAGRDAVRELLGHLALR